MNTIHTENTVTETDIAVIGMSCNFPDAHTPEEFWDNVKTGRESMTFFSDEELMESGVPPEVYQHPNYVRGSAILGDEEIKMFDASFFGYTPREAQLLDPQQRLFLEEAWKVVEHCGYDVDRYPGLIGVYAGIGMNVYLIRHLLPSIEEGDVSGGYQVLISNDKDFVSTRVSYKLNLKGPSLTVQTACSTSLVAIHLACQSLLNGESDIALAGGTSLHVPQKAGYMYQEGMILSPDGHCRAFDKNAQGVTSGSGVGLVALKRLEDALADGDTVYAVVKGSAANNDGSLKVGYTAPSVDGQASVIAEAQAVAGIEPATITYIETHGTGTVLGDPIEIRALNQVFRASVAPEQKRLCALGSVKTNFGHLDAAAGVAGFMKAVLALHHKQIPPSLHFEEPNPKLDLDNTPFYVNNVLSDWQTEEFPRRAGVSSFGIGGTNAHVVLQEAPPREPSGAARTAQLLLLSARTETALNAATENLADHFTQHPDINLADAAYTLQTGRKGFKHRRAVVCRTVQEAESLLRGDMPKRLSTGKHETEQGTVVFLCTGQGSQYVNMGLELYQTEPVFRETVDYCAEYLKPILGLDLRDILYPEQPTPSLSQEGNPPPGPPQGGNTPEERLKQTAITQPALFTIEYAMAKLWMEWGVQPQAVIGHSIGEYAAACIAGIFSLDDALSLVAERGKLMQELPKGTMFSVPLPEEDVKPLLNEGVSVAAVNSPLQTVVSGPEQAIEEFEQTLKAKQIEGIRLQTSHAFHSVMMEPIVEPFTDKVKQISLNPPDIQFISTVAGGKIADEEVTTPEYWARNLRQPVRFAAAVNTFFKEPSQILLEIGPGRTLSTLAKRHPEHPKKQATLSSLRHPKSQESDMECVLLTLGNLWIAGADIDWNGFYAQEHRQRVALPTYPFQRKRYWIERGEQTHKPKVLQGKNPNISQWFYLPEWRQTLPAALLEHDSEEESFQWLIFSDLHGLGASVIERLKATQHDVTVVRIGSAYAKTGEHEYILNPEHTEEYDLLLDDLHASQRLPDKIAHLWSLTETDGEEPTPAIFHTGFYSLFFLAKALGKHRENLETVQLMAVSNNIYDVSGEESLCPQHSLISGLLKVIPQEYPHIRCRHIDVPFEKRTGCSQPHAGKMPAPQLWQECISTASDPVVAYRGKHRWIHTFEAAPLEKSKDNIPPLLRENGVYLLTGGLGGIGLTLAEYLATTVNARLILIGRSAFPEHETWQTWLAEHDEQDRVSQKIRKIQAFEQEGADVLILSADVSSEEQMQGVIARTEQHFGQIHGVIHAAGVLNEEAFTAIEQMKKDDCEQQFTPKITGTLVLEKLFREKSLDFCILMSSLSSVLGGLGFAAYSSANAFLDAFAQKQNRYDDTLWLSINWDGWNVDDVQSQETPSLGADVAELAITRREGVEAFERILSQHDIAQMVVSTGDLDSRIEKWVIRPSLPKQEAEKEETSAGGQHQERPDISSDYAAPQNEIEQAIITIWQELLGIEPIGIHDDFFELGGNSLLAVQIKTRLCDMFQIDLPMSALFEEPAAASLARKIKAAQQEAPVAEEAPEKAETEWEEGEL